MASPPDLTAVFYASPNPYMILDRNLRYVAANDAYLQVTGGKSERELVGRGLFELFPDDPRDPASESARRLKASFEKVIATGEPDVLPLIPYRLQVQTPEGVRDEQHFWSATHSPLLDEHGRVAYILQHTVNITELHQLRAKAQAAENALHNQAEAGVLGRAEVVQRQNVLLGAQLTHLKSVFEQAPGFTCVLHGPKHTFELANAAYRRLIGREDILGRTVDEVLPEVASQGFISLLDRVYQTGEPFVGHGVPVQLQKLPGAPRIEAILDFVYQPLVDAQGQTVGIFVQGNDITAQRRLEQERAQREGERLALLDRERAARAEAENASRLKDEFLATVSHELRTPLTAMLGWVQMLRSGRLGPDRRDRALETIERNARTQAQLVEDLLDVSRIMSGKLSLSPEPMNLAAVVDAAIEVVRPAAAAKQIELHSTVPPTDFVGDPARLQQVIWNLLINAVKFTPRGGRVDVALRSHDGGVDLVVTDTGQGISTDFLPYVFDRFRQAESSATRQHGGLGLGLAIVKHVAELHGGTVSVASDGPGRGASFTLSLPTGGAFNARHLIRPEPRPFAALSPLPDVAWELKELDLLVVDDEEDARDLLRSLLEQYGASVRTAASAKEALSEFEARAPDVLISDLAMPLEDGFGLLRAVQSLPADRGGKVPAVAISAHARSEDRTRALLAGFKSYVSKPLDAAELLAVVVSVAPTQRR